MAMILVNKLFGPLVFYPPTPLATINDRGKRGYKREKKYYFIIYVIPTCIPIV